MYLDKSINEIFDSDWCKKNSTRPLMQEIVSDLSLREEKDRGALEGVSELCRMSTGQGLDKFPGMSLRTMTLDIAKKVNYKNYVVSRKIDGLRSVIVLMDKKLYVIFRCGKVYVKECEGATFDTLVFDGEFVVLETGIHCVLIDAMFSDGKRAKQFGSERTQLMCDIIDSPSFGIPLIEQEYIHPTYMFGKVTEEWEGLVLIDVYSEYMALGGSTDAYKYVHPCHLTMDLEVQGKAARSYDGTVYFEDVDVEDGVYEFSLNGVVGKRRRKYPNRDYVIGLLHKMKDVTVDDLKKAMYDVEPMRKVSYYNHINNVDKRQVVHMDIRQDHITPGKVHNKGSTKVKRKWVKKKKQRVSVPPRSKGQRVSVPVRNKRKNRRKQSKRIKKRKTGKTQKKEKGL